MYFKNIKECIYDKWWNDHSFTFFKEASFDQLDKNIYTNEMNIMNFMSTIK